MDKDFKVVKNGTTLDIVLGSELSTANAPALAKELSSYCGQDIEKVVFDATGLTYLSSAGIRTFFFVYHELGSHIEIVVVNCVKEIYNILEYVGLNSIVKFEHREKEPIPHRSVRRHGPKRDRGTRPTAQERSRRLLRQQ